MIRSGSSWLSITAWAMRRTVAWIKREYGDIPIVITENGFSDKQGNLDDMHRIYYLKHYINQLLKGTTTLVMIYKKHLIRNICQILRNFSNKPYA